MSATQAQICNMALRSLGAASITAITDGTDPARVLNDVYDLILDEVITAHPWNFAIKRTGELTALGGLITTWTAEGTANVWQAALTTEPAKVKFNGTDGTEKTSVAALTAENYWYWLSDILYVYSTSDPDTAYVSPGINAVIPEFKYAYAYEVPSDTLRIIREEDDSCEFEREADRILTDDDTVRLKYIAQITDTSKFPPAFVTAFAARLAAEIAFSVTNKTTIAVAMLKIYEAKLKMAKAADAQEGTSQRIEELPWEDARG